MQQDVPNQRIRPDSGTRVEGIHSVDLELDRHHWFWPRAGGPGDVGLRKRRSEVPEFDADVPRAFLFTDGLEDASTGRLMGSFAQEVADQYQLTRESMDEFAIASLSKAAIL